MKKTRTSAFTPNLNTGDDLGDGLLLTGTERGRIRDWMNKQSQASSRHNPWESPADYDEHWTIEDERWLEERWQEDEMEERLNYQDHAMIWLWQDAYTLWACSPFDILSPRLDFEVDVEVANSPLLTLASGKEVKDERWPEGFCEHLRRLLYHPVFGRDPFPLQFSMQSSVELMTPETGQRWGSNPLVVAPGE